mmetsp:Transcript_27264/g.51512  ORF Transcript_27264/g.51512 Transcript_27264/m.51512 type:complete len:176 (-) Transcript_27264:8-535(-)
MMNQLMAPQPKKTQKEIDDEEEKKRVMEEEKKKYDPPIIRLKDTKTELETDDLTQEELSVLKDVGRRGYYHARPATQEADAPQRIENPETMEFKKVSFTSMKKRTPLREAMAQAKAKAEAKAEARPSAQPEVKARAEPRAAKPAAQKEVRRPAASPASDEGASASWFGLCCRRRS